MFPCTGLTCMIEERFIINIELAKSPLPQSVSLQTIIRIMAQQNYCSPSCIEEIKPEPLTNMTSILVYYKWWGGHNSFMEHLPQKWLLFDLWTLRGLHRQLNYISQGHHNPKKYSIMSLPWPLILLIPLLPNTDSWGWRIGHFFKRISQFFILWVTGG